MERNRAFVAQKIQTLYIDDLDGSPAEGTVRFGLDGSEYEIDLNTEHAKELRSALTRYVDAARRVSGGARRQPRSGLVGDPAPSTGSSSALAVIGTGPALLESRAVVLPGSGRGSAPRRTGRYDSR